MMRTRLLPLIVVALIASGCGDDDIETPTTPTTPITFTEVFSGTVTRNGAQTHSFSSQASGTVTATLTALAPDAAVTLGLALGTWNGVICNVVLANDKAVQSTVVTGAVSAVGSLCVRIFDAGALPASTDYEIQVVHP